MIIDRKTVAANAAYNKLAALRATVEDLTKALEKIAERYTLPWDGTTGQYLVEIENCARAALARAKGGE